MGHCSALLKPSKQQPCSEAGGLPCAGCDACASERSPASARPFIKTLCVTYACLSTPSFFDLFIMQSLINQGCLLLICCPTDDAVGDFAVRFFSNFYSTQLNRSGVRCALTQHIFHFPLCPKVCRGNRLLTKY